jgi:ABC-type sulfate/molybdate transport systems ATPase subunit
MDEPFASLDDEKRAEMRDLLRSLLESTETTLVLVTHAREDAFDLGRRILVLDCGRAVADDLLETVLTRPRHAAAVRALGLGQIVPGEISAEGDADTAFGKVLTTPGGKTGPALLLVRPDQPRIVVDDAGVEAEVVSLELRPSDGRAVRRIALVRVGGAFLRVFVRDRTLTVGRQVRLRIDGECEKLEGSGPPGNPFLQSR